MKLVGLAEAVVLLEQALLLEEGVERVGRPHLQLQGDRRGNGNRVLGAMLDDVVLDLHRGRRNLLEHTYSLRVGFGFIINNEIYANYPVNRFRHTTEDFFWFLDS